MITQPISENLRQGDIVKEIFFPQVKKKAPAVCLTPACDLVTQENAKIKANYVLFCFLIPDYIFFRNVIEIKKEISKNQKGKIKEVLKNRDPRYYWIYNSESKEGYIVDYQIILSVPFSDAIQLERIYSLQSSYRECLATRYSSYSGRIGTEDIELESSIERIVKKLEN